MENVLIQNFKIKFNNTLNTNGNLIETKPWMKVMKLHFLNNFQHMFKIKSRFSYSVTF